MYKYIFLDFADFEDQSQICDSQSSILKKFWRKIVNNTAFLILKFEIYIHLIMNEKIKNSSNIKENESNFLNFNDFKDQKWKFHFSVLRIQEIYKY